MRQNTDKVSGLTSESLRSEMTSHRLLTPSRRLWRLQSRLSRIKVWIQILKTHSKRTVVNYIGNSICRYTYYILTCIMPHMRIDLGLPSDGKSIGKFTVDLPSLFIF